MTQNLGRIGEIHSYISVWIPNMILFVLVIYSSYKMQKEVPFQAIEKLSDDILSNLPSICGAAFVKKDYFKNGIVIAHEGYVLNGKDLIGKGAFDCIGFSGFSSAERFDNCPSFIPIEMVIIYQQSHKFCHSNCRMCII